LRHTHAYALVTVHTSSTSQYVLECQHLDIMLSDIHISYCKTICHFHYRLDYTTGKKCAFTDTRNISPDFVYTKHVGELN